VRRGAAVAAAGLAGLLAAGTAVGVGELVAAAVRPSAAPVIAVGGAAVDRTPRALKEFAIRNFGENDKHVLLAGIFVALALFAIVVGIAGRRSPVLGAVGIGAFGVVGAAAALSRPGAGPSDALPSLVGAVAAIGVLQLLLAPLRPRAAVSAPVPAPVVAQPLRLSVGAPADTVDTVDTVDTSATGSGGPPRVGATVAGHRDRKDRGAGFDRRAFLVRGTAVAAVAALAGFGGRQLQRLKADAGASRAAVRLPAPASPAPALPAAVARTVPGQSSFLTRNADFYRVDTALVVPQVPTGDYTLRLHGMVDREISLDYQTLLDRPLVERTITMTCVSNEVGGGLVGTARWLGVPLAPLLREAGVHRDADQIVGTSTDGMTIGTPTAVVLDGRDAMLAVGMNGEPLPLEHGFPVRMIVPGLYGYVSATKWLVELELTTFAKTAPYWVQRGWVPRAPIRTSSRLDTPKPFAQLKAGMVAVAGVAWAQHRGVSTVEVRVDDGPWQPARIVAQPSIDTWVQWVFPWSAKPGQHTLTVRATDRSGQTQEEKRMTPFPSGSTGWHSVVVTVS
jgi:DMSO/TMAO reductase YedYZ molybdopterin-dependent catalytic subunit